MPLITVNNQNQALPAAPALKRMMDAMAASINSKGAKFIKFWLPVLICMGVIFYFSSFKGKDIPSIFYFQEIVYHFSIYLILCFLFARALKNSYSGMQLARIVLFSILFGIIYGLTDEFHQAFIPGRSVSGMDLFIDSLGSLTGSIFYNVKCKPA
jgi:VanZ family protein